LTPSRVRDIVISKMPRLALGSIRIPIQWMTEEWWFDSQQGQRYCHLQNAQTSCGINPYSHSMGTEILFPGGKTSRKCS